MQTLNPYLDYLIDPNFQEVNRLFVLSFENTTHRTVNTKYYFSNCRNKRICYDWWTILITQWKIIEEHMMTFEKLGLVKEMITLLVVN